MVCPVSYQGSLLPFTRGVRECLASADLLPRLWLVGSDSVPLLPCFCVFGFDSVCRHLLISGCLRGYFRHPLHLIPLRVPPRLSRSFSISLRLPLHLSVCLSIYLGSSLSLRSVTRAPPPSRTRILEKGGGGAHYSLSKSTVR